jgi:hypothetical protein
LAPDQDPEAVQAVALVADQVSVELLPLATVLGLAARLMVGTGCVTVTVADCAALPPLPVQLRVYVAFAVRAPVDCEPFNPTAPDQAPEATHEVAFVDDNVSIALLPLVIALGPTLSVTVGAAGVTETVADCAALPPLPVQVSV